MKTLHIVRKPNDVMAIEAIEHSEGAVVLLIQDGVLEQRTFPGETYACEEDVRARGIETGCPTIDYDGIAGLIALCERVITW